jgi:hypothetical protein
MVSWSRESLSRPAPPIGRGRWSSRASHAGPWQRPSRRAGAILFSKRCGRGRIAPVNAPLAVRCLLGLGAAGPCAASRWQDSRQRPAWYDKPQATFADGRAAGRRHIWGPYRESTAAHLPDLRGVPKPALLRLVPALCDAPYPVQSRARVKSFSDKYSEIALCSPGASEEYRSE